jgi:hypothetical protein
MVINDGEKRIIWVACDLLFITEMLINSVKTILHNKLPGFCDDQLIMSATHVHTAPFTEKNECLFGSFLDFWADDPNICTPEEYVNAAAKAISEAILDAEADLSECNFSTGISRIKTGYNRRVKYKDGATAMYGDVAKDGFIGFEGRDGGISSFLYVTDVYQNRLKGVVACIPCTAQVLEGKNYVSSDYWGYVRSYVPELLGKEVKVLGLISSAGDLSPRDLLQTDQCEPSMNDEEGCGILARRITDEIYTLFKKPVRKLDQPIVFNHIFDNISLPAWNPKPEQYLWAKQRINDIEKEYGLCGNKIYRFPNNMRYPVNFELLQAEAMVRRHEKLKEFIDVPIHAVLLGHVIFITNPFEMFLIYGERIKALCKDMHIFDCQCCCNSYGYFPTPEAAKGGGYSGMLFNGVCVPESGEQFVAESVRLIKSLKNE